ncbi:hypothetical protein [Rhodococcus sp. SGAir0479]|uniref:hypothetical protein n=1 Tax=Rhodococcus sp. SGAir0479 TaxID=2567884 RepID=UPI0010CCE574|nr:hypothetical protein [Rhodococcus sp. SGAir0479]QCQ91749.1 hypothetical protein E7742_11245 [Rhodococcus sp. SGAir0479]
MGAVVGATRFGEKSGGPGWNGSVLAAAVAAAAAHDVGVDRRGLPGREVVVRARPAAGSGVPVDNIAAPAASVSVADTDRDDQRGVAVVELALFLPVDLFLQTEMEEVRVVVDELVDGASVDSDLCEVAGVLRDVEQ